MERLFSLCSTNPLQNQTTHQIKYWGNLTRTAFIRCKTSEKAIYDKWKEYADFVRGIVDPYIQIGTWNRQVDDLIEFYAVWTEMQTQEEAANASASPYHLALQEVEGLMAARKTLRDF